MLIDTHCHLDFNAFDEDRDDVLQRASAAGISRMVVPAVDLESCGEVLRLAIVQHDVYAAIGVHPNHAQTWQPSWVNDLRRTASHPKVVAIGEIGLDYYWTRTSKETQKKALEAQLNLAVEMGKPVILHSRESIIDLMAILGVWTEGLKERSSLLVERPGVLHSFSGSVSEAEQAVELKFMIGITGPVTFLNAKSLKEVVTYIPLKNLVIETDAPFLTPHPHRGKRNEPSYVQLVAEQIASLKRIAIEEVARQTTANAMRLFNWREVD
jgi:TatD DNase family protein